MARPQPAKHPVKSPTAAAVEAAVSQPGAVQVQHTTQVFEGPVPHPDLLARYDDLVPGTAQRMIQLAEDESLHRRKMEEQVNLGNVQAQAKQLEIADYQSRSVFRSDTIGQVAGALVSLSCVAGAIYLSVSGHEWTAAALAAIPTAAVIQAFFTKRTLPQR